MLKCVFLVDFRHRAAFGRFSWDHFSTTLSWISMSAMWIMSTAITETLLSSIYVVCVIPVHSVKSGVPQYSIQWVTDCVVLCLQQLHVGHLGRLPWHGRAALATRLLSPPGLDRHLHLSHPGHPYLRQGEYTPSTSFSPSLSNNNNSFIVT